MMDTYTVEMFGPGLLMSCRAAFWVSVAAGKFRVFWIRSGSTSLQDMSVASGTAPWTAAVLAALLLLALLPCQALSPTTSPAAWPGGAMDHLRDVLVIDDQPRCIFDV